MLFKVDSEKMYDYVVSELVFQKLIFQGCGGDGSWSVYVVLLLFCWLMVVPRENFEWIKPRGSPLPFLFLRAVDGLNSMICASSDLGVYIGFQVANGEGCRISHLHYTDNTLLIYEKI